MKTFQDLSILKGLFCVESVDKLFLLLRKYEVVTFPK